MVTETLAAIVLSWLVQVSPPERMAAIVTYPEAHETAEERLDRYRLIAEDIAAVAWEGATTDEGRRRAAALLVGIAWHESNFQKDVDLGPCAPGRLRKGGCDGGRARGLWQIQGHEVVTRRDGARLALRLARHSLRMCRYYPVEARLSAYASGTCESPKGQERSRELWAFVKRFRDQ